MKIAFLIYGSLDTLSGGYLYDRKLVEYLRAKGDQVEIISLPWRNYAAHLGDNLTFRLPPGFDLLIEDELNHPSLLAANSQRRAYPLVSLVHHLRCSEQRLAWQNVLYRVIEKMYLNSVDAFIYNSKTTQAVVSGLAGAARPALIAYPPTDRFGSALPADVVAVRAIEPGPLRVVFLGNVIPRKGLHTLLEAARLQASTLRLDVIGSLAADPVYARKMQQKAREPGQKAQVFFHGPLDEAALVEKLKSAQVLATPSSYEGFGIVYLEGMAFGLPAIGTTAGAAAEIIADGETGYLIRPDDSAMLAARLDGLANDRDLLARLSLRALRRYAQQPTWQQTAEDIRRFLQNLL